MATSNSTNDLELSEFINSEIFPLHFLSNQLERNVLPSDFDINSYDVNDQTLLHYAVKRNDKNDATRLLDQGAKLDLNDDRGQTALHYAAKNDDDSILKLLMECDEFKKNPKIINLVDENDMTMLHVACQFGKLDVVKYLVKNHSKSLSLDVEDSDGWNPLHLASINGSVEIIKLMIDVEDEDIREKVATAILAKDDAGSTPLNLAAERNHTELVKLLQSENKF